jgi:Na+:H+ antiporter, NhaA family
MPEDLQALAARVLPIEALASPFARFAKLEAAGGVLLLASTIAALVWANSPWKGSYDAIWNTKVSVGLGHFVLSETRHEWINDGLMAVFFFLVGLEIKREILIGELSSLRHAALPLMAAIGGAVFPAIMYLITARGTIWQQGWGIPMATDIAFALGTLAILGSRIPASLKIFVTALAIVDDIIAVLVIAVFYTNHIAVYSLIIGLAGVGLGFCMNLLGVRNPLAYAAIGVCIWVAVLKSGIHATAAGVLLAFTIPARTRIDRGSFIRRCRALLDRFERAVPDSFEAHAAVHTLEAQCELVESPLHRVEHYLQPWVSFLVMPLFAFANAGVTFLGTFSTALKHPVSWGVALGLLLGKPVGIWLCAWLSVKARLAARPAELSWGRILGASWLCGIGFTMSLFMATLAFGDGQVLNISKIGTLAASLIAGILGSIVLRRCSAASSLKIARDVSSAKAA